MHERFLRKWFGREPVRPRDCREDDHPMVRLGAQLRTARIGAGLTQLQLEELTAIDQTTISRLETGKGSGMRLERFAALLAAVDAEIRPIVRTMPSWLAPILEIDEEALEQQELGEMEDAERDAGGSNAVQPDDGAANAGRTEIVAGWRW